MSAYDKLADSPHPRKATSRDRFELAEEPAPVSAAQQLRCFGYVRAPRELLSVSRNAHARSPPLPKGLALHSVQGGISSQGRLPATLSTPDSLHPLHYVPGRVSPCAIHAAHRGPPDQICAAYNPGRAPPFRFAVIRSLRAGPLTLHSSRLPVHPAPGTLSVLSRQLSSRNISPQTEIDQLKHLWECDDKEIYR